MVIDGYIIPKNDEYFNEYVPSSNNRLKFITNFSGSTSFAVILKNKNYFLLTEDIQFKLHQQTNKFKYLLYQINCQKM